MITGGLMAGLNSGNGGNFIMANKGYRGEAIKAAKDLGYGEQVVRKIREAKSEAEIERIMFSARNEKGKYNTRRNTTCLRQDFLAWAIL